MKDLSLDAADSPVLSWAARPSRRSFVRSATGVLAAPAITTLGARAAWAASGEILMPMSGGTFQKAVQTHIADTFEKKTGIKVRLVSGNMKAHALQLLASRGQPPFDVFMGNGDDYVKVLDAKRLLPLTADKVPNLADIHPKFKDVWNGLGSYFDYSSVGIAYRPEAIKNPPKSWRELVDRTAAGDFGNNVFFPNLPSGVRGAEMLITLSRVFGGSPEATDAGFDAIRRMKPHIFKFYSTFNDPVTFLLNGEGHLGTGWDGRTFIAADESGGKVEWLSPAEGAASSGPVLGVVKGGNEEAAFAFIDHALGVEAQKAFCEDMFYGSPNKKVVYSEKLAKRIPKLDEVSVPSERFIATNLATWIERWNREIAV